jgi:hypothetical protein
LICSLLTIGTNEKAILSYGTLFDTLCNALME